MESEPPKNADLVCVRPDGTPALPPRACSFPNGSVITPDGTTLIVGETIGAGYEAFTIEADGSLSDRRRWADSSGHVPRRLHV